MLTLSEHDVVLNCQASSKAEALRLAADSLMLSGYVKSGFFDALVLREKSISTYVGAGIALPHCMKDDIDLVIASGFQVFQFPQGVSWGNSKVVFIVVAVAAKLHEHLDILAAIADLLGDELKTTQLAQATRITDFIETFEK